MEKLYIKDVPDSLTIQDYIHNNTNISNYFSMTPDSCLPEGLWSFDIPSLNIDFESLASEVDSIYDDFNFWGWSKKFQTDKREDCYGGISLTHNPNRNNNVPWQVGLLGEVYPRLYFDFFETSKGNEVWNELVARKLNIDFDILSVHFGAKPAVEMLVKKGVIQSSDEVPINENIDLSDWSFARKDSYYDTLSFRTPTPACRNEIGKLFSHCQRTVTRSRIMTLKGLRPYSYNEGWHRDEHLLINTRILLPVTSNEYFKLKIDGYSPRVLDTERFYTFNSRRSHGIGCEKSNPLNRHLVVLGFSPWFDYLPEEEAFIKNEFYGKVHPYDMLIQGHVYKDLVVRNEY